MKNLGIFYFIFVVMLSILPCNDELEAHQLSNNQIEKISHDINEGTSEHCLAICLCNCCGQSIIPVSSIIFELKTQILLTNATVATSVFQFQQNTENIWQPPKLI